MKRLPLQWILAAVLLILALAAPVLLRNQQYWLFIAIQAYFWAMLASSWALLAGYAGQFSFGHIAFMAIAAYTSGILGRDLGWSPVSGIIAGTLMAGVVGLIIGWLCLRLRRTYLALFTIAFAEIFRLAVNAELDLTGGPMGLYIEYLLDTTSYVPYYYIFLGLLLGSLAFMYWLASSRFGLFFRSIREDEEAAAAMGVHIVRYKIMAFVVTSMIAGLAGAVDHHLIGFIAPSELIIGRMSLVIAMAVIGGIESLLGAALGAIFIHFSLEWLQQIPVPASLMPKLIAMAPTLEKFGLGVGDRGIMTYAWRMVAFGLLLMLTLRFWRNGLIHPIIDRLTRQRARKETVAKRVQAAEVASPPTPALSKVEGLGGTEGGAGVMIELDIRDVYKSFGGIQALNGVSLNIRGNELIGLIGPNGAGKTTLTNVLDGVYKPTGGEVWLNGQRISGLPPYEIARRGIGRTFQVTRAFRRMTVLENMLVPAMALHPTARQRDFHAKAMEVLEFLTIEHLTHEYARSLSGGQQKLLELGRLLMLDPDLIILDEPFAGVHPKLMETIYEYIRTVHEQGKAFIIISHDMDSIFTLSKRLLVLNFGELIADGDPAEVKEDPVVIEAYLGEEEEEVPAVIPAGRLAISEETGKGSDA